MIKDNFDKIRQKIAVAQGARQVQLVAVSKKRSVEAIRELLAADQRQFGENRVQEAEQKFPALREVFADLELHLIGPLQTNKVARAVELFDVIQTLDRPKLAEALAREMKAQGKYPRLFIEVNIGHEPQKAGVMPEDVPAFLTQCREMYGLSIEGLMAMPPFGQDPVPYFEKTKDLADKLALTELSMGMSADFEAAIKCGASFIRVGTALFRS
ncbi:MAG TPA: YggS family pyridoxal phosphate-dependent enzyme [Rhodospirillaceae bacterium]|nr:YggS family pyridoxal phosphate-dependent enzyme [Rhodospirillaceae bacterium]